MNNKKKLIIRNVLLSVILICLIVLVNYTRSSAQEWASPSNMMNWGKIGDTVKIGYNALADNDSQNMENLYCAQHDASLSSSVSYGLIYKVRIEGNHAISSHTGENGQPLTSDSNYNGMLAYILGGGDSDFGYGTKANKTDRQKELWSFWNKWIENSGKYLGIDWNWDKNDKVGNVSSLENEATNYVLENSTAAIISNVGTSIDSDNTFVGPFNVTYTGNITSIDVIDNNGNKINDMFQFVYSKTGSALNPENISSGKNFYINNWSGRTIKEIRINVGVNNETINVDLLFLKSSKSGNQKLLFARPERISNPQTASTTISVASQNNVLRVVKHRADNQNVRQTGVGFIINKDGSQKGYLRYNNNGIVRLGKMEFNSSFEWVEKNRATIFETVNTDDGWKGYFQISGIPAGKYYIGEVYNKNSGFEDSTISRSVLERYKNNTKINEQLLGSAQRTNNISGYTQNKLQVVSVDIQNDGYIKVLRVYDRKVAEPEPTPTPRRSSGGGGRRRKLKYDFKYYW